MLRRYLNLKGIISRRYAYKGPDVVQIDLTDKCNSGCSACWTHSPLLHKGGVAVYPELDCEVLKGFIDELKTAGTRELIFSGGGEPFMHPRAWEIFSYAQEAGMAFRVNTNFTLLNEADILRLVNFKKLVSLTVSVWAGSAKLYALAHNRKPGEFFKLKQNLAAVNAARKKQLEVKLYAVVSNLNYSSLEEIADLACETGCSSVEFGMLDVMPGTTSRLLLDRQQLDSVKRNFLKLVQRLKNKKISVANKELFLNRISSPGAAQGEYDTRLSRVPCYAGWLFLRLRANGDFNSCLKSHCLPVGNIYKESFGSVWNGPKQQAFRKNGVSLPRNREYYGLMGNSPGSIGCTRICDNALVNEHMHKRIRLLLPARKNIKTDEKN
jgi:MoaA/NifB/PqqE/SkfB family radical SAM enzyme